MPAPSRRLIASRRPGCDTWHKARPIPSIFNQIWCSVCSSFMVVFGFLNTPSLSCESQCLLAVEVGDTLQASETVCSFPEARGVGAE